MFDCDDLRDLCTRILGDGLDVVRTCVDASNEKDGEE